MVSSTVTFPPTCTFLTTPKPPSSCTEATVGLDASVPSLNVDLPSNICSKCFLPTNQILTRLGGFMVLVIMSGAVYLHLITWGHEFSRSLPALELFFLSLYFIINPFKTSE